MTEDEYREFMVKWMKEMYKKVDNIEQYLFWIWGKFC